MKPPVLVRLQEVADKHSFDALVTAALAWLRAQELAEDYTELQEMLPFFKRSKQEVLNYMEQVVREQPQLGDTPFDTQLDWVADAYEAWLVYEADLPEPGATPGDIQTILAFRYPVIVNWSVDTGANLRDLNVFQILDMSAQWAGDDFYEELEKQRRANPDATSVRTLKNRLLS